jgi:hypothetical protein
MEEISLRRTIRQQCDEIQHLNDNASKISNFVFSLPVIQINPEETHDTETTIRAIAGLYEAYEAKELELRSKEKEVQ